MPSQPCLAGERVRGSECHLIKVLLSIRNLILLLGLFALGGASAQSGQQYLTEIHQAARNVQMAYSTSQSMLGIYEMAGNAQGYQQTQYEMGYHEQIWDYLEQLAQNPGAMGDPAVYQEFQNTMWEYYYRTHHGDYRPYEQIAANLRAFVAQRQWEASTPEGRQAFQARMDANNAVFEASQRAAAERSATLDQNHASYIDQLRNTPTNPYQSDYDGHNQFIDSIHETTSFDDPYSGRQITQDGQYDYWYQDNLGNYYGTDDPGFDPNSLQGNWERIDPLASGR